MRLVTKASVRHTRLELFQRACEEHGTDTVDAVHAQAEDAHVLRARGEEHAERGDWAAALAAFNAAVLSSAGSTSAVDGTSRSIDLAIVHELKAQTLLALGDDFEAARSATDSTRCDGDYAPGFHTLGRAQRNMGELALAVRALETAEMLFVAQHHADAAEARADLEEAEALLVRSIVLLVERGEALAGVDDAVRAWRAQLAVGAHVTHTPMNIG